MNVLSWLLFGLIAGVIANLLDPAPEEGGIIGATVLGMLGALLGGFMSSLVFGVSINGFNFTSFVIAILGSLILLFLQRAFSQTSPS